MSTNDEDRPAWDPYDPLKRELPDFEPSRTATHAWAGGNGTVGHGVRYVGNRGVPSGSWDFGGLAGDSMPAPLDDMIFEQRSGTNDGPPRSMRRYYPRSDTRILDDIAERLYRSADIDASDVSVEVQYAIVTLQGSAGSRRMKHDIEDLAADTPGVKEVENRIRVTVSSPDSTSSMSHDMSQGNAERPRRGFATPDLDPPPGGLHTPQHEEWLLDEGVEESFPASDTPSSIQPGSIAANEQSRKS